MATQLQTFQIPPGSAEKLVCATPTKVTLFMFEDADVLWLTFADGDLDPSKAVRIDKAQCPVDLTVVGTLRIHSPAQDSRTVAVSVISEARA
jgi:hypothetical protein